MSENKTIVIIAENDVWQKSLKDGTYAQSTINSTLAEVGFIHCSFPNQTMEILKRRFTDGKNLLLLLIDSEKVHAAIKYEGALSGREGTFPHIYGHLNVEAVKETIQLEKNKENQFITPTALQKYYL